MTASAFSAMIPGITDISSLYFSLINVFLGSLNPSLAIGATLNGAQANWFVPYPGYSLPVPVTVGNTTITTSVGTATTTIVTWSSSSPTTANATFCAFLQSSAPVDSYLTTDSSQTYNLLLKYTNTTPITVITSNPNITQQDPLFTAEMIIYYGTNNNFTQPNNGNANNITVNIDCPSVRICGSSSATGAKISSGSGATTNASKPSITNPGLMSLVFTPRGFALNYWLYAKANNCYGNSMLVIQRPVNPTTGLAHTQGDAPIFSLARNYNDYGLYTGWGIDNAPPPWDYTNPIDPFASDNRADYSFWFSVIRSNKITVSSKQISTNSLTVSGGQNDIRPSFYRWSMDWNHANLYDNFSNVIKFMYGFFTTYHLYLDEMDLVCLVNALSFTNKQPISITMYGESSARTYNATYGDAFGIAVSCVQTGSPQNPPMFNYHTITNEVSSGARLGILFDSNLHH
jgi:hypothetical protein